MHLCSAIHCDVDDAFNTAALRDKAIVNLQLVVVDEILNPADREDDIDLDRASDPCSPASTRAARLDVVKVV